LLLSEIIYYNFLHAAGYPLKSLSNSSLLYLWSRRLITVFTKAHHWTLSWASRNQFTSL